MSAFVFVEVFGYVCAPISLASNILLLVIIRNSNSRHLVQYNVPLSLVAVSNILLSVIFLLCQPCVLVNNDTALVILLGPATFVHPVFAVICFVIFEATVILCTLQVASVYAFKFFALKRNNVKIWQTCLFLTLVPLICFCIVAPMAYLSFETAVQNPFKYEHYNRIVRGFTQFDSPPFYIAYRLNLLGKIFLLILLLSCCVGCTVVAVITIWSSPLLAFINNSMNQSGSRSGQIVNAFRVIGCSIGILVVLPLVVFTVFALFDLPMYSYSIPLFLGVAFVPILNAYFVIFNIRTFRRALSDLLSWKHKSSGTVSHISSDP